MKWLIFFLLFPFLSVKAYSSTIEIKNVYRVFSVSQTNSFITQSIMDEDGIEKYIFVCMDYNKSETYEGMYGAFSGFYQCKLISLKDESDIFQPVANWGVTQTRARFFLSQIIGGCENHPLYGHRRIFLVRGMRVIIDIFNFLPKKSPGSFWDVYNFKLKLEINNYPEANGDFSGYASEMCEPVKEEVDKLGGLIDNIRIKKENSY